MNLSLALLRNSALNRLQLPSWILLTFVCSCLSFPDYVFGKDINIGSHDAYQKKFEDVVTQYELDQIRKSTNAQAKEVSNLLEKYKQLLSGDRLNSDVGVEMLSQVRRLESAIKEKSFDVKSIQQHFGVEFLEKKQVTVSGVFSYQVRVANNAVNAGKCLQRYDPNDRLLNHRSNIESLLTFNGPLYDSKIRFLDHFVNEPGLSILLIPHFFDFPMFLQHPKSNVERLIVGENGGVVEAALLSANLAMSNVLKKNKGWHTDLSEETKTYYARHLNSNAGSVASTQRQLLMDSIRAIDAQSMFYEGRRFKFRTEEADWLVYYRTEALLKSEKGFGPFAWHCGEWVVERREIMSHSNSHSSNSNAPPSNVSNDLEISGAFVNAQSLAEVRSKLKPLGLTVRLVSAPSTAVPKATFLIVSAEPPIRRRKTLLFVELKFNCSPKRDIRPQATPLPCEWGEKYQKLTLVPMRQTKTECLKLNNFINYLAKSKSVSLARNLLDTPTSLTWAPYSGEPLHFLREQNWVRYLLAKEKSKEGQRLGVMAGFEYFQGTGIMPGDLFPAGTAANPTATHEIPFLLKIATPNTNLESFVDVLVADDLCINSLQITNSF
jgi:hypothetical protein